MLYPESQESMQLRVLLIYKSNPILFGGGKNEAILRASAAQRLLRRMGAGRL